MAHTNSSILNGLAGNDYIQGDSGNGRFFGDEVNDQLYDYAGDDRFSGDGVNNTLHGGYSRDTLKGSAGNNQVMIAFIERDKPYYGVEAICSMLPIASSTYYQHRDKEYFMMRYQHLNTLKQKLDTFRPLPQEVVANLHEDLVLRWTYHSNAIEGNTLTLKETKVALEGITVGGKTMREHFEAINHKQAILFVEDLVTKNEPLSEWQIKAIHQLVLKNIDDKNAGVYRKSNVIISGAEHIPPAAPHVESEMQQFIFWYQSKATALHPVERAARVHVDFVKTHPFVDGNGRTSRLLMNLELMKSGFPPVVIPVEKRLTYYEALDMAHSKNNYEPFLALVADLVASGFEPYWYALGITP